LFYLLKENRLFFWGDISTGQKAHPLRLARLSPPPPLGFEFRLSKFGGLREPNTYRRFLQERLFSSSKFDPLLFLRDAISLLCILFFPAKFWHDLLKMFLQESNNFRSQSISL
jgi:hypothetical protein